MGMHSGAAFDPLRTLNLFHSLALNNGIAMNLTCTDNNDITAIVTIGFATIFSAAYTVIKTGRLK